MSKGWTLVFVAGAFEVIMAICLKHSNGFKNLFASFFMLFFLFFSFYFLSLALRIIPLSSAYAIWTGIGALGTFLMGVAFFGEAFTIAKLFFLILTLSGIIGLKYAS